MFENGLILHPTDFSPQAAAAFEVACALARDKGARLMVLHVVTPPVVYGELVARRQDGYWDELNAELRRVKPADPVVRMQYRLEDGDPAEVIVSTAETDGCDVIVMGTHGRSGLGRVLMGSVAEQVIRKGPCPVLTVRSPAPAVGKTEPPSVVAARG
jgi:universal stress protein A